MVESKLTYEECRRQRVEENKKRMEELNLCKLAEDLKASSPKSTPVSVCVFFWVVFESVKLDDEWFQW